MKECLTFQMCSFSALYYMCIQKKWQKKESQNIFLLRVFILEVSYKIKNILIKKKKLSPIRKGKVLVYKKIALLLKGISWLPIEFIKLKLSSSEPTGSLFQTWFSDAKNMNTFKLPSRTQEAKAKQNKIAYHWGLNCSGIAIVKAALLRYSLYTIKFTRCTCIIQNL